MKKKNTYTIGFEYILEQCQLVNWTLHALLNSFANYSDCCRHRNNKTSMLEECFPFIKDFVNSIEEYIMIEFDGKDYKKIFMYLEEIQAYLPKWPEESIYNRKSSEDANLMISGAMVKSLIVKYSKSGIIAGFTETPPLNGVETL